jgi:hypothetical protein
MLAPLIGKHTEYVCKELLSIPKAEFDQLIVAIAFGLIKFSSQQKF